MANVVSITLNAIDKTKQGFTGPIKNLQDLEKRVAQVAPAFATLGTTVAAAFGVMVDHALETAESFNKMAQSAGTTVESFSANAYAAKLSGLEADKLEKAYRNLGTTMIEASKQGTEQAHLFASLGISATDASGKLKTVDQVLLEVADRFANTADGIGKTAVAGKLFGEKLGQDVIPFLNQGAAGLRDLQGEALRLGQVFTGASAKAAEEYRDNLEKMKLFAQGLANVFAQGLLPSLEKITGEITDTNKESKQLNGLMLEMAVDGAAVGRMISAGAIAFGELDKSIDSTIRKYTALAEAAAAAAGVVTPKSDFMAGMQTGEITGALALGDTALAAKAARTDIEKFTDAVTEAGTAYQNDFVTKVQASQKVFDELFSNPLKNVFNNVGNSIGNALLGGGNGGKPQMNPGTETGNAGVLPSGNTEAAYRLEQEMVLKTQEVMFSANESHMALSERMAAQLEVEKARALEMYQDRLKQIGDLGVGEEQGWALSEKAYQEHAARMQQIGQRMHSQMVSSQMTMLDSTASIFGSMAALAQQQGAKGFAMWKAFSYAQAVVSIASGIARAFADFPFPVSLVVAGAVAAAGAVQINAISSAKPPQAHGGADYIPEEATYLLNRGERVLAPEQNVDLTEFMARGGGSTHVTVNLDGREILDYVSAGSRSGQLVINARAVA